MQYEDFKQYVVENIRDYLPPVYRGREVSVEAKRKNNNVVWDALSIKGNGSVVPAIYMESFYSRYENGRKMEDILRDIAYTYTESMKQDIWFSMEDFQYEKVKDRIFVTVQNAEMNTEFLKDVPHEIREDLALAYRIDVQMPDGSKGSAAVTNRILDMWGIDKNTLSETAWSNMHNRFQPVFNSMGNVLSELGYDEFQREAESVEMYVLTNRENNYGAAYMFDRDVMNLIAERLESDIVVIPSSVHEILLMKKKERTDFDVLEKMVQEVNSTCLHEVEILSDSVYQYSRDTQTLFRVKGAVQEKAEMPDQKVSVEEMHAYGYTWEGMLPLTKERALELMDTELQVFKLYADNAEGMAENKNEIISHGGLFGVEKKEWEAYQKAQNQEQTGGMIPEM